MRSHLQDDVVIRSGRNGDLLHNWRILGIFVWDVVELFTMPYQQ